MALFFFTLVVGWIGTYTVDRFNLPFWVSLALTATVPLLNYLLLRLYVFARALTLGPVHERG